MRFKSVLFRSVAVCALVAGTNIATKVASAADFPTKAPARSGCVPAVDGLNGKLAGLGGTFANQSLYGAQGSVALPLGCEFGVQVDATAASFDGRFLGNLSGHLFWRDPAKALLGVYGSSTYLNQFGGVRANRVGAEGELYFGQWTLQGLAGVEFGNTASGTVNGLIQTYDISTRFFDQVNLNYYLQDNLKVTGSNPVPATK
jgi:hypothetical protein